MAAVCGRSQKIAISIFLQESHLRSFCSSKNQMGKKQKKPTLQQAVETSSNYMKNLQTTPSGRYLDSNISPALTALLASLLSLASADSPTKQPRPGNRGHGKRAPSLAGFAEGGAGVEHPAQAPGVRAVA